MATVNKNLDGNTEWSSAGHIKRGLVEGVTQSGTSPNIEGLGGYKVVFMRSGAALTAGTIDIQMGDSLGNYFTINAQEAGYYKKVDASGFDIGYLNFVPANFRFVANASAASGSEVTHDIYYEIHKMPTHDRGRH